MKEMDSVFFVIRFVFSTAGLLFPWIICYYTYRSINETHSFICSHYTFRPFSNAHNNSVVGVYLVANRLGTTIHKMETSRV